MIDGIFSHAGIADTHGDLIRNIVSLRRSEDLFDDLSEDPADWQSAIRLELSTKPPLFVSQVPVIDRPFEEAQWNDAIGYPFRHWMRSRYSDGSFGIWYGADTIETTVHETAYHWRNHLLADAGFTQPGVQIERKIYKVRCDAALLDLRQAVPEFQALVDPNDYSVTHLIGARLHREGHPGLLSKSARCDGDVYAVLNPDVLSQPRPSCFLTYVTTSSGISVSREHGAHWLDL